MTLPNFQGLGGLQTLTVAGNTGWPTHATNDIGVLIVETANETANVPTVGGWAEADNSPQGTGTAGAAGATRLHVFWKRAASGGETAPDVNDAGDHTVSQVMTIRGCITTGNPIQTSAGNTVASTATIAVPGGTTTAADELIVFISSWDLSTMDPGVNLEANPLDPVGLANTTRRAITGSAAVGNGGGFAVWTATKALPGSFDPLATAQDIASVQAHFMLALLSQAPSGAPPYNPWPQRAALLAQ